MDRNAWCAGSWQTDNLAGEWPATIVEDCRPSKCCSLEEDESKRRVVVCFTIHGEAVRIMDC